MPTKAGSQAAVPIPSQGRSRRWKRWVIVGLVLLGVGWGGRSGWTWWQMQQGEQAADRRDFAEAQRRAEAVLVWRPGNLDAILLAARSARRAHDSAQARQWLERYVAAGGDRSLLMEERDLARIQVGELDRAGPYLQRLQREPNAPSARYLAEALSLGAIQAGRIDLATLAAQKWLDLAPSTADRVEAHLVLGLAAAQRLQREVTLEHFRQAVTLAPDDPRTHLRLGQAVVDDAPQEAVRCFETVLRLQPQHRDAQIGLARARRNLGELEAAAQILEQIPTGDTPVPELLLERGMLAQDQRQLAEAESWIRQAVAAAPQRHDYHYALAQILRQLGKTDEAEQVRQRAAALEQKRFGTATTSGERQP